LRARLRSQAEISDLHIKFLTLVVTLDDIRAGPIYMRDLLNATRPSNFEEFITFLQVLEIYGTGYDLDEG
jgi:hypothetical protein